MRTNIQILKNIIIYVNIISVINMKEIQNLNKELIIQKKEIEHQLNEKQLQLKQLNGNKESIIIKKIGGSLYYYSQCREEGKVKSRYLKPVMPGAIAEEEVWQQKISQLQEEIEELEWNLESIKQLIKCLNKRLKRTPIMNKFTFEVYWKDEITARVYVKGKDVTVSRFTENPGKQLFAQKKMTRFQLGKILELRCWEKNRADIGEKLTHLGLKEYNPYEIVKRTHGVSYNDFIWFRFPGEKLTSKDVLVR